MIFGKHINKYYGKYFLFFLLGILALLLVDWVQLYLPEFLGDVVGIISGAETINGVPTLTNDEIQSVYNLVINILVVGVLMFIGRMSWRLCLFSTSLKIENNLREEMFLKAERLSSSYYQQNKVGNIMAWFGNDLSQIEECTGFGIVMIGDAVFLSIFSIGKMIAVDWVLTIIACVPVILIVVWGAICEKIMVNNWDKRQKAYDKLYDFTQENFTGIRVIKAFVKELQEIKAFKKVARENYDTNLKFSKTHIILDVIIEIIIAFIFAILIGFGGYFVLRTFQGKPVVVFNYSVQLSAKQTVEFIGYFDSLIWPMIALGQIISMAARAKASLKRISDFLDTPEDITNKEGVKKLENCKGKIEYRNFYFRYPTSDHDCIKNINITIKPGEIIGVIGRLASGKTSLFNCLSRLYNVNPKSLFIDDIDIMDLDFNSVRDAIAYCPQDNFLFSSTLKDNISFSSLEGMSDEEIEEAAKFADVHNDIMGFKDQYNTISGERGVTLSGGQKQRISIARAYAKKAPIMILDDSVSAVDVKTEENIIRDIHELRKGKTTIVIASRVSTIRNLDRILVLKHGEVEAFGTHDELMKCSKTYQKMVHLQALEKSLDEEGK